MSPKHKLALEIVLTTIVNRIHDITTDALTTAPEDLSGLSSNVPPYGLQREKGGVHDPLKEVPLESNHVNEDVIRHTEDERSTLRRVSGSIPWVAYSICIVEFAERAYYYGTSGVFSNFVQFPLP